MDGGPLPRAGTDTMYRPVQSSRRDSNRADLAKYHRHRIAIISTLLDMIIVDGIVVICDIVLLVVIAGIARRDGRRHIRRDCRRGRGLSMTSPLILHGCS